ncbi:recombinase family protein [Brevibacillus sp. H7]|uniref:recombinase family protein n=1 Tax=Brevibacillus sp. H7 TaxID=3349138 RepID=UPI00382023A5
MRTALYIRVSTEEQAKEGFSIAAQRDKLLSYLHSQGWTLCSIYTDEGFSAKNTSRPELQRLLADMRSGKLDVVLVYRLDRLTRSVLDLYQLLKEFDRYGVRFKSCTEVYDTTTAIGRLFITLVAALAQWERENLAERVKLGMGQMVREKKRPGGPPPYGYDIREGRLAINPHEAEVVRCIYRRFLSGFGPLQIAEELNRQGYRGKMGAPWSAGTVSHLLQNHVYSGTLRWNYALGGQRLNPPEEWMLVEQSHPPIVEAETFDRVQQLMEKRRKTHPRALASDFIFSGILYCSRCGSAMSGKTASTRSASGKRYTNRYYLCKNKRSGACQAPAIREDLVEQHLTETLLSYREETRSAVAEAAASTPLFTPRLALQEQLRKLAQKRQRWEEAYGEGLIPLDDYRRKLEAVKETEAALHKEIAADHTGQMSAADRRDLLLDFSQIWSHATLTERKHIASLLLKKMEAEACPKRANVHQRTVEVKRLEFH